MEDSYFIQLNTKIIGNDWLENYADKILDAKYEQVDVKEVVQHLGDLSKNQKSDSLAVLTKHAKLFDGTLGVYPHKKFHIGTDPDAKSVFSIGYPVPWIHMGTFKHEIDHLISIGTSASKRECMGFSHLHHSKKGWSHTMVEQPPTAK